jgi:multiple sugar transport system permease protein
VRVVEDTLRDHRYPVRWSRALAATLYYVVGHIPLTILAALGLALLCNRKMPGVTWYRTAYFTPVITNVVAIGLVWSYFYAPNVGILNWFLSLFGVRGPSWLTDVTWAMPAVILVSVWQGVGYPMVILLAALQSVPEALYDTRRLTDKADLSRLGVMWPVQAIARASSSRNLTASRRI